MSRTVTALFDSRGDAEAARARFISQVKTQSTRIIAKDTLAATDSVDLDPRHVKTYQDAIRQGGHLLVAQVEAGQEPKRIIAILEEAAAGAPDTAGAPMPETPTYGFVGVTDRVPVETAVAPPVEAAKVEEPEVTAPMTEAPIGEERRPVPSPSSPLQQALHTRSQDELRVGMPLKSHGGARVRSVVREIPAEEQIDLREEQVGLEHQPSERRLSFEDVKAGGLLRDRIFEIREMREEPVVTKEAFVREEVIVRKTVREHQQTIRDTVRRTEVEVEEIGAPDDTGRIRGARR
jgi:hypothetical protein